MAKKIGRPKKRRTRTTHRGVKLLTRRLASGSTIHIARWTDPDSGRVVQVSLDKLGKHTEQARRLWAVSKSNAIANRAADIEAGAPPKTSTEIGKAIDDYLASLTRNREKTKGIYEYGLSHFAAWARKNHKQHIEDLKGGDLVSLEGYLRNLKAQTFVRGKGLPRGARRESERLLAPATVNQFVRTVRSFLRHCRRSDIAPHLTSDVIRDRLRFLEREVEPIRFLEAFEVRKLLEAAIRHDAVTHKITRAEARAGVPDGETYKYPAIAPFIAACLLTGCRFSELANLTWANVNTEAQEIKLSARQTKTKRARPISLRETPTLPHLLARLKLRAGAGHYVFGGHGPLRRSIAEAARRRLYTKRELKGLGRNANKREAQIEDFAAPTFSWHDLRRTCGTYLTCAPSIFGAASAFMSARRLGHSVIVAEKHYVDQVKISPEARTLEDAYGCMDLFQQIAVAQRPNAGTRSSPLRAVG